MAHRFDNDVEFVGNISGGGSGNLIIGNAVSVNRRTPADVMDVNDTMFIKIEESGQHETTLCTLISSTEMVRTRVIDRWDRTGALVTPVQSLNLAKVQFSTGQVYCAGTLPQPINIVLQPDGTFAYSDEVRKTLVFPLITGIQDPLSNILDGQIVFAANGLVNADGLGGLFLYDQDGDNGTIDNVDIYAPGTVGSPRPGILIRQRMDIMAAFFRQDLSIYTPVGATVVRRKIHSLARGVAGADDAWMGEIVQRGTDANGAFTDLIQTARDRQAAEAGYVRHRSYEASARAFDTVEFLKPFKFATVAAKADVKPGMCARVTADEKLYFNDPDRGLAHILLSDGGPRATVENIAGIRLLTPDGYQDGEVVVVEGHTFRGDGEPFLLTWSSGSATADNGVDVFKPTLHADGDPWVEPGRFIAVAPIRAIKFIDNDATPSVAGSSVFTGPDVAPAGGVTAFDDFRNNKLIKLQPGIVDLLIKQSNGNLELPGRVDFTLSSIANGGSPIFLEKENGVVSMVGGGASPGFIVSKFKELSGEYPVFDEMSDALQAKIIGKTATSLDGAAIADAVAAAVAAAQNEGLGILKFGPGHWWTELDTPILNPGLVFRGAGLRHTRFFKNGNNQMFFSTGAVPNIAAGFTLASDTLAGSKTVTLSAGGGSFNAQTIALLVSEDVIQAGDPNKRGEFVYVQSVAGNVVTLRTPPRYNYLAASTARLLPLTLLQGVGYEDFAITMDLNATVNDSSTTFDQHFGIDIRFAAEPYIKRVRIDEGLMGAVHLHGCYAAEIDALKTFYLGSATTGGSNPSSIDGSAGFGYSIVESGLNVGLIARGCHATAPRHAYTTVANYADASVIRYGVPTGSMITDYTCLHARNAAFDTHSSGLDITFNNCKAKGGLWGFQIRSPETKIINCEASDTQGPGIWLRGGEATTLRGDDCVIENFKASRTNLGTDHPGTIDFREYGAIHDEGWRNSVDGFQTCYTGGPGILCGRNGIARGGIYRNGRIDFPCRLTATRPWAIEVVNANATANLEFSNIFATCDAEVEHIFHRNIDISNAAPIPVLLDNVRGSGNTGFLISAVNSDAGITVRNADGNSSRTLIPHYTLFEDFDVEPSVRFNLFKGSNASAADPALFAGDGSFCRLALGVDAGGTMALNGSMLQAKAVAYRANVGGLFGEAYCRINDAGLNEVAWFFGFSNFGNALHMPFALGAGNALTAAMQDGFGLLWDPAGDTNEIFAVAVKDGVVTGRSVATGFTPATNVFFRARAGISAAGSANFWINGAFVANIPDAVNVADALRGYFGGFNRSATAGLTIDCDYIKFEQSRN